MKGETLKLLIDNRDYLHDPKVGKEFLKEDMRALST